MRGLTLSARAIATSIQPSLCLRCVYRAERSISRTSIRNITSSARKHQTAATALGKAYFFANERNGSARAGEDQGRDTATVAETISNVGAPSQTQHLATEPAEAIPSPGLRRRDRLRRGVQSPDGEPAPLPLDASAQLSSLATSAPPLSFKRRALAFLALTKPRLATLIVLTTTASYSLYPVPSLLSVSATQTPSLSTLTLAFLTTGTFATVASANALNMLFEPAHDAKMSRTRNRPIVRGLVSKRAALLFALLTGAAGTGILWTGVNPTTAVLGLSNIVLYACVYTPMKQLSVLNTWAGAIVGAIPPLMGWTAAGGHYLTTDAASSSSSSPLQTLGDEATALLFTRDATGGWLLAALLFAWQFPHFNALSHPIRHEYANAGYRMAVSLYPRLNARVALRYSLAMFPICAAMTYCGVTDRGFLLTSSVANAWMLREAWRFWRSGGGETAGAAKAARGLFWASVWHLPLVLVFAMAQKKGLWGGVWRSLFGDEDEEDEDGYEDEDEDEDEHGWDD